MLGTDFFTHSTWSKLQDKGEQVRSTILLASRSSRNLLFFPYKQSSLVDMRSPLVWVEEEEEGPSLSAAATMHAGTVSCKPTHERTSECNFHAS
jgi:hypothetical protein